MRDGELRRDRGTRVVVVILRAVVAKYIVRVRIHTHTHTHTRHVYIYILRDCGVGGCGSYTKTVWDVRGIISSWRRRQRAIGPHGWWCCCCSRTDGVSIDTRYVWCALYGVYDAKLVTLRTGGYPANIRNAVSAAEFNARTACSVHSSWGHVLRIKKNAFKQRVNCTF